MIKCKQWIDINYMKYCTDTIDNDLITKKKALHWIFRRHRAWKNKATVVFSSGSECPIPRGSPCSKISIKAKDSTLPKTSCPKCQQQANQVNNWINSITFPTFYSFDWMKKKINLKQSAYWLFRNVRVQVVAAVAARHRHRLGRRRHGVRLRHVGPPLRSQARLCRLPQRIQQRPRCTRRGLINHPISRLIIHINFFFL